MTTLAIFLITFLLGRSTVEAKAQTIASHYAGMELLVECKPFGDSALGRAYLGENRITLSKKACAYLARPDRPGFAYWGLLTVIHEAFHHKFQTTDENVVECAALAQLPDALHRFYGWTKARVRAVMVEAREFSYCGAAA